jgi:hypothetical protein
MDREALDGLSREELLELLVRHVEVVGQQQEALAERDAAIERRDEKIRKAGPKRGQVGSSRLRREPDVVVASRPGGCGGPGPVSWRTAPRRSCA